MHNSGSSSDTAAFAALVDPHLDRMAQAARRILRCPDLAADALQETLVTLWQHGMPAVDLRAWLVRTVVHRSLHLRRTRRRALRRELACTDACRHAHEDPLVHAIAHELADAYDAALAALPPPQRAVVDGRDAGLDYDRIAQRTAMPIGTVRSRLHRARATLQSGLQRFRERDRATEASIGVP